jgi:hypothetical protein
MGKKIATLEADYKKLSTVGEDFLLLNLKSPHTYIAQTDCVALVIDSLKFGKVFLGLGD